MCSGIPSHRYDPITARRRAQQRDRYPDTTALPRARAPHTSCSPRPRRRRSATISARRSRCFSRCAACKPCSTPTRSTACRRSTCRRCPTSIPRSASEVEVRCWLRGLEENQLVGGVMQGKRACVVKVERGDKPVRCLDFGVVLGFQKQECSLSVVWPSVSDWAIWAADAARLKRSCWPVCPSSSRFRYAST